MKWCSFGRCFAVRERLVILVPVAVLENCLKLGNSFIALAHASGESEIVCEIFMPSVREDGPGKRGYAL